MSQKRAGIIIQYLNVIIDFLIALFLTPFLLKSLGDGEYGLYRIVQSFAGQLSVLSFGIATLVARNIVRYNVLNQQKEKENFLGLTLIITLLLMVTVALVGFIMFLGIDSLFDASLDAAQLVLSKKLFWILIANIIVTIAGDMGIGILVAHEKFAIRYGLIGIKQIVRVCAIVFLINMGAGSLGVVLADLIINIIVVCITYFLGFVVFKEKAKFHYFDKIEFKASFLFSFAILLQAIVNQVNQNLDCVILGSLTNSETVAMYSVALTIFTMFNSITMVFGTVFVPQATKMITKGASGEELTDLVVKPGRYAIFIGLLIISGFALFGREFISIWVGENYSEAYYVALILMIPALIPLMQNVTNAVLDAMMKRLGRSIILLVMAAVNVLISIVLVKMIGYIGAAIGTAFSFIFGYLVLLNIHLKKATEIKLGRMYKGLLSKNVIVAFIAFIMGIPLMFLGNGDMVSFFGRIVLYTIVYCLLMFKFGMNKDEKNTVVGILKRII